MISKIKSETNVIDILAETITNKLNNKLNKEGLALIKMKLGIEILLINTSKILILLVVAAQCNLLKEAIFMSLVFGSIRRSAFGLHARSSVVCTLITLMVFVGGPYISQYVKLNNYQVFGIFTVLNLMLYKYAPADTEKHPILGKNLRKKLRKETVSMGIILMIITLIIQYPLVKSLIILAVSFEVISILPITYKTFNRGYRNYEQYEK